MRLLLIEDDVFFRKFYVEKLKEKGFEIEEADDDVKNLAASFSHVKTAIKCFKSKASFTDRKRPWS